VPENQDYEWLGRLVDNPEKWTEDDLAAVQFMIETQKRAIADSHPEDEQGRRSYQDVVDQLEAALRAHLARAS
jgi:hypothetical protein